MKYFSKNLPRIAILHLFFNSFLYSSPTIIHSPGELVILVLFFISIAAIVLLLAVWLLSWLLLLDDTARKVHKTISTILKFLVIFTLFLFALSIVINLFR